MVNLTGEVRAAMTPAFRICLLRYQGGASSEAVAVEALTGFNESILYFLDAVTLQSGVQSVHEFCWLSSLPILFPTVPKDWNVLSGCLKYIARR